MPANLYNVFTLLIVLTAVIAYINFRFLKLPATIGIMLISLICSLAIIITGRFFPKLVEWPVAAIGSLDFENLLMKMMLSFLLFAGSIQVDIQRLKKEIIPVATFSTLGVILSTLLIGTCMYWIGPYLGFSLPYIYWLLFGALISPTDPIAVLGILKKANIPPSLEIKITGESLFNDGVGVVVFLSLLDIALEGTDHLSAGQTVSLFLKEAGGGIIWGMVLGYAAFYLLRSIDHYQVEVLITVAIVMGGYLFASEVHISGPLAMVIAGIIVGNKGQREAMSDITRDYVNKFWELVDEILNSLLFLLIGFEIIVLSFNAQTISLGLMSILVVLAARYVSILVPTKLLAFRRTFEENMIPILTWGGLRGGISVALALSLPKSDYRSTIVSITYIVVVFSIVVQGLTIGKLVRKYSGK